MNLLNLLALLNGKKTLIAAGLAAFAAFNAAYPVVSPDMQDLIFRIATGLGLWGLAHKAEKVMAAVNGTEAPKA